MAGLASKFKGNSYVRDAVVDGGTRMGAGGGLGFVARTFGGMAARNGAELTGDSISSVAARPASVSGSIGGDIANRSLKNYMPHMAVGSARTAALTPDGTPIPGAATGGAPLAGARFSNTQISGGRISTTATMADGKTAAVDMYSASQFDKPSSPHSVVTASDGSQWYQMASGEGMGAFYAAPRFNGDASEAAQVAAAFHGAAEGTTLRTVDNGVIEASHPESGTAMWLNSAHYQEPDAPHDNISDANGVGWYAMHPHASVPEFESAQGHMDSEGGYDGASYADGGGIHRGGIPAYDGAAHADSAGYGDAQGGLSESAMAYNRAQFQQFMPGYETAVSQVDASRHSEGMIEVRHADGSGTQFYDKAQFQSPRGDHKVYEDSRGHQWYAVTGTPSVERRPVYEDGKPVYDGEHLRTVNVESVKYKAAPGRFNEPQKRDPGDRKPPNHKRR
jgi:hypothetical protein